MTTNDPTSLTSASAETLGPQWREIVALAKRVATLLPFAGLRYKDGRITTNV